MKLNIEIIYGAFSCAGGGKKFDFTNLYNDPQGLTGSESNCFLYAKALGKLGHDITIFTYLKTPAPLTWEGITVRNIDDYHQSRTPPDVQIAWNEPNYLFSAANCSLHVVHQQLNDFGYCHPNFEDVVDVFCSPSQAHLDFIKQETPKSHHKWNVISNCVDLDLFKPDTPKVPGRIIFASSPDRGLHLLLSVYPKIKKAVKNANLRIMYDFYSWYNRVKEVNPTSSLDWHETSRRANYIKSALDEMKNGYDITHLNTVSRHQVAKEMNEATVLAYPVSTIRWSEGFSVVAAESCAAGAVPVLSDCDAMGSIYGSVCPTIKSPASKHLNEFTDLVITALTDETFQKQVRAKTIPFAQQFNFDHWAKQFETLIIEKCKELKRGPWYEEMNAFSSPTEPEKIEKHISIQPSIIETEHTPKVSILVSTFRPGGIDILMAGMKDQTFKDFELIIADRRYDKRHKEVMALAKEYGINCIHVPEHRTNGHWNTFCSAWNTAIALSKGEYIFLLADWTYAPPGWIEAHLEVHKTPNRYVLSRYVYTNVPDIKWKKDMGNIDLAKQMEIGYKCITPDRMLDNNIVDEIALFKEGKFSSGWLSKLEPSKPPDQDLRYLIANCPGLANEEGWAHVKCESVSSKILKDINGLDERLERGKGPMDIDLATRLKKYNIDIWWDPNIPYCTSPNPRWYFRAMPWGSMKERLEDRWSYRDGLTYIQIRVNEIEATTTPEQRYQKIKAKNLYDIREFGKKIEFWRDEQNHPVKSLDVSDIEYWGREIWPESE
jgi:glycosyltransferase involved in cell wall biosynthesis